MSSRDERGTLPEPRPISGLDHVLDPPAEPGPVDWSAIRSIAPPMCESCDFFHRETPDAANGECRINPPRPFLVMQPAPQVPRGLLGAGMEAGPTPMVIGAFPATQPHFWCGCHSDATR